MFFALYQLFWSSPSKESDIKAPVLLVLLSSHSQPGPFGLSQATLSWSEEARYSLSFASQRPLKLRGETGKPYLDISLLCFLREGFHGSVCKGTCPGLPRCMDCPCLSFCTDHTRRGSSSCPLISYLSVHAKVGGILTSGQCSSCAGTCPDICI